MPTVLGIIFLCYGVYYFLLEEDALFGLLIVASVFQASSAVMFGERGIQIYYFVETLIIARALLNCLLRTCPAPVMPQGRWLLIFGVIAVASAVISPAIFSGVPIYDPLLGIDEGLLVRPPLHFGISNMTQATFLVWHIATAYALLVLNFSAKKTRRAFIFAFYIVVFVVFAQSAFQVTGLHFPDTLVRNNPNIWDLANSPGASRKPGTFLEPSFAGACLIFYSIAFIAKYFSDKGSLLRVIVSLFTSGMITSSGSILALCISVPALVFRFPPYRLPWYINIQRTKRLFWILFLIVTPLILGLIASGGFRQTLLDLTVSKGDSGSFFNRTASDLFALQLLFQTHGIGVGLGSNRSSSLATSLLSNVGIAGFLAFTCFFIKLFGNLSKEDAWLKWAGFALLLNMCIDVPDVTMPTLWIAIFLAILSSRQRRAVLAAQRDNSIVEV